MSNMLTWSTKRFLNEVPSDLRPPLATAKGQGRYFKGRKRELELLAARHERDPATVAKDEKPSDASFITVVHNAPGVGKSALLDRFTQLHEATGGYILPLTAHALRNEANFTANINDLPSVKAGKALRLIDKGLDAVLTLTGMNLVRGLIKLLKTAGEAIEDEIRTPAEAKIAIRVAQQKGKPSGIDLLRIMADATDGRTIIIVDEAQSLGLSTPDDSRTASLLQQLGDPSERARLHLRSGGVILAGLPDVEQRLATLHKSRTFSMPLTTLPSRPVAAMLREAWRMGKYGTRTGAPLTNEDRAIIDTLAHDFGGWTHHAYNAAFAAEGILYRIRQHNQAVQTTGKGRRVEPTAGELRNWIRSHAALGVCQLHDRAAKLSADYVGPSGTYVIVQEINKTGTVHDDTLSRLFDAERRARPQGATKGHDDQACKERLLHCGLLSREIDAGGNATGRMVIPIPSLQTYLMATKGKAARPILPPKDPRPPRRRKTYIEWEPDQPPKGKRKPPPKNGGKRRGRKKDSDATP